MWKSVDRWTDNLMARCKRSALCRWTRHTGHHIGRRGFVLIMLGWIFFGAGLQVLTPEEPRSVVQREATHILYHIIPEPVWGLLFIVACLLCWVGTFVKRYEPAAFFFSAWIWTAFGVGYILAMFGSGHPVAIFRGAITDFVVAGFVVLASTWKEHP